MRWIASIAVFSALALLVAPALAGATAWVEADPARVRLLAAPIDGTDGEEIALGIEFDLAPGWKTYWRSAGDSGLPPQLDWSGSENLADVRVEWPAPKRFTAFGFDSFGYSGQLVLPVRITRADIRAPTRIRLRLNYLTCSDVCVPLDATLELVLGAQVATDGWEADLIESFAERVPPRDRPGAVEILGAAVDGVPGKQTLRVRVRAKYGFDKPDLMVEAGEAFRFGRPEVSLDEDRQVGTLELAVHVQGKQATDLRHRAFTLTLVDGALAAERTLRADPVTE